MTEMQPKVPLIELMFETASDGTKHTRKRVLCLSHPNPSKLMYDRYTLDSYGQETVRGLSKFSRKLSKSPIYINFPVSTESGGGYAYDLGFLEDSFTATIITTNYSEYLYVYELCKRNIGEVSAVLRIGHIRNVYLDEPYYEDRTSTSVNYAGYTDAQDFKKYNVIVRSSDAEFDVGSFNIRYTLTLTVVYDGT